jgi:hypothetical protein
VYRNMAWPGFFPGGVWFPQLMAAVDPYEKATAFPHHQLRGSASLIIQREVR